MPVTCLTLWRTRGNGGQLPDVATGATVQVKPGHRLPAECCPASLRLRAMEVIIPVIIVLAIVSFIWGRAHASSFARKIGEEVGGQRSHDDPVVLLEKLHQLKEAGALTEAE